MDVTNKVALVTGGASGLGLATATPAHLRRAATVVIVDLPPSSNGKAVADELGSKANPSCLRT